MTKQITVCPICEEGNLVPSMRAEQSEYKNTPYTVDYEYSECDVCGTDLVFPEQVKKNRIKIKDEYRKILGLLTSDEIISARNSFDLNQSTASLIYGGGPNSFSKYERGEVIQSEVMDNLIRFSLKSPNEFINFMAASGKHIKPKGVVVICDYNNPCENTENNIEELAQLRIVRENRRNMVLKSKKPLINNNEDEKVFLYG